MVHCTMHPSTNNGPAQDYIRGRSTINEPTLGMQRGDWTKENQFPLPNPKLSVQSSTCLLGHQREGNDGRGGTVKNMVGKMEDKDNNTRTRATDGLACRIYRPACIYTIAIQPPLGCHTTSQALFRVQMGNVGRHSTSYLSYVAPQFLFFWQTVQIAPNFLH